MEAMSAQSKLNLENPPVVETALQIQFSDLPHWSTVHHGLYFPLVQERFPKFKHTREIPPVVETFPPFAKRIQFQLRTQEDVGCAQFEAEQEDRMIRVQRNRFAYHWLGNVSSAQTTTYPSYESNLKSCLDEFNIFASFCEDNSLGKIAPLLCEVMYLNQIKPLEGESVEQMVESVFGTSIGSFEMFTLNRTFAIEGRGRLYAELNTSIDEGNASVTFQLTSRINHVEGTFQDSLDLAHKWLVDVFCNLTSPVARKDRWNEIG